jgi:hypothetical protein
VTAALASVAQGPGGPPACRQRKLGPTVCRPTMPTEPNHRTTAHTVATPGCVSTLQPPCARSSGPLLGLQLVRGASVAGKKGRPVLGSDAVRPAQAGFEDHGSQAAHVDLLAHPGRAHADAAASLLGREPSSSQFAPQQACPHAASLYQVGIPGLDESSEMACPYGPKTGRYGQVRWPAIAVPIRRQVGRSQRPVTSSSRRPECGSVS